MVLCFKKPLSVVGLGPLLPSAFSVLKIKMGQKKWRVSRLIIKSEDLISFKSILWETATHQCQLCLLLESIIFLKSYLILWKCNLYNIKCKQTFPENHDLQKRDYHFRMEVVQCNRKVVQVNFPVRWVFAFLDWVFFKTLSYFWLEFFWWASKKSLH